MSDEAWTEETTELYRDLAQVAVPERERQIGVVTALVAAAGADGPVLDLCCGEGLMTSAIMEAVPGATVLGYDGSAAMLDEVRRRVPDPSRLQTRQIDLEATDWRNFDQPLRAVVSSLAIHHLDGQAKHALFADIRNALAPGGVFVLADVVEVTTGIARQVAADMWDEEIRRRSLDHDGTLRSHEAFRKSGWNHFRTGAMDPIDKPSTLVEHVDWLRAAGFADIDLHWAIAGHVLLSAWRR